jgi:PAS domain S-box-containing protein
VRSLTAEGIESRAARDELLSRNVQSERILQTLRGGLLKLDGAGRITLVNPACAEILSTSISSLEGKTLEEAFPRDVHLREILRSVSESGGSIDDVETSLTTGGGRHVSVSVRASCLRDSGESAGGVLVLLSDLSRRKEVEEEIRKADRLAALGRLSAGVAHEIRNPLAGIRTTAEILRNRVGEGDDLLQFVDVILEEAARLDRIVGSLLQFAKPSEPRMEPVEIRPLLERARQLAASRAADRRVTIRVTAGDDLPAPPADRDQLLQVLLNLFLNGIEATPEGGELRAFAQVSAAPGRNEVRIFVEDEGEGVSPGIRERIFDPFFTTKPGGTGLGLSISQNIVRQHGGRLRIENRPSGATRAVVLLPLTETLATESRTGERKWPTS